MSRAKKHFGQHFLHEHGYLDRIVAAIAPQPGDRLVEIGPGEGAMTFPLLKRAGRMTAIELDTDLIPRLRERAADIGELEIIQADVLSVDFTALAEGHPLRIVGNLPYYISSPILFHCLKHVDAITDMHFMLQKEVVDRMAAAPGSKIYGRLSVMLQLVCEVTALFTVPPGAFRPPPKVDSAVVRLRPRPLAQRPDVDANRLYAVVRAAFAQRRKTLGNALKGLLDAPSIAACGIDPKARAETLAPADFVLLTRALTA
ncbi:MULTISPECIES: 16S rRNA (adenine(1518)-N(6)/adenine(1519)-N(6))-dimethyltransferase RsmA [Oleiagrimonas]|uniref:Ribosomal RNA small subunit methyltransferase A n=1 Tax=Oleiagrimonas citrea TaxID=1665687 RepID=A0A846ZPD5_9GAMM|nr:MULTISPECIES: 16S rRNA (adenine(1518)-N(6)/adenine(1519)-N(6))-dimethyltransferase RsmA [Oleiagrimonas]NKZ39527.1 16S rRNA (adenine(1518)-N(6)/adenine(1519)-N(6))-dimethyltransferase RsmA [Oleiagrimonas citrea]RAP59507.1 16S rRNA (adenine(1518)-N(6)/adenine(1519)-N(6))-dimethyltransferase [Oleiagrimonas sp. MCCC 1A03011]